MIDTGALSQRIQERLMIKGHDKIVTVFFINRFTAQLSPALLSQLLANKVICGYPINLLRLKNKMIRLNSNIVIDASCESL